MKIAQFRTSGQFSCTIIFEQPARGDDDYAPDGTVRVSEWLEVEFVEPPREQLVAIELRQLEESRANIVEEFSRKLKALDDRKAGLLAITHEVSPA